MQYVVNEKGEPTAVVIDLRAHAELWKDFHDGAVAEARRDEPREPLTSVRSRLASRRRTRG